MIAKPTHLTDGNNSNIKARLQKNSVDHVVLDS
jgi:hypothetical protein